MTLGKLLSNRIRGKRLTHHEATPGIRTSPITSKLFVRIRGGLGNQLFQASAALSQSRRIGCELGIYFEKSAIGDTPRDFELKSLLEIPGVLYAEELPTAKVFLEKSFRYDASISKITSGTLLDGYFQSWRYVWNVRQEIAEALLLDHSYAEGKHSSEGREFIALHLRRGDYLRKTTASYHGVFGTDYYKKSLQVVRSILGPLPAVVFSDSHKAALQLSKELENTETFSHNEGLAMHSLGAMSSATAWILANSSFSWWAAFLGGGLTAVCVAPRPWFRAENIDTRDLLPPDWLTVGETP